MSIRHIQNSLVSGEIAPSLWGRHDLKAYFSGAAQIRNMVVRKSGGLRKRAGTDIALDITTYAAGRLIPFYYSPTSSTLILLCSGSARFITRSDDGLLAFIQSDAADYTIPIPWSDAALATLRHYQIGDTIYLSCAGYRAHKLVRTDDTDWTLTPLDGIITVPQPAAPTATPAGFSGTANTTTYALFAIKDGVYSAPATVTATTAIPWTAGATVSLAFTPDLATGVTGYVLGKTTGAYYGILQEYYPTATFVALANKRLTTSGVDTSLAATRNLTPHHAAALAFDPPDQITSPALLLNISKYCIPISRTGTNQAYAEYESATPFTLYTVGVLAGTINASTDMKSTSTANYYGLNGYCQATVYTWNGAAWVLYMSNWAAWSANPTTTGMSYLTQSASATQHTKIRVYFDLISTCAADTSFLCRGIALFSTASWTSFVTTGTWTLPVSTPDIFTAIGVSSRNLSTYQTAADLAINTTAALTAHDDVITTNVTDPRLFMPVHTYAYHAAALALNSCIYFTPTTVQALSAVRIWFGATTSNTIRQHTAAIDYAAASPHVTIYGYNGDTPTLIYDAHPTIPAIDAAPYYAECAISSSATFDQFNIWFTPINTNDTGVILRGIALMDRAGTPAYLTAGSWLAYPAPHATTFSCTGIAGTTLDNANHLIASLGVLSDSDATARLTITDATCTPARIAICDNSPMALTVTETDGVFSAFVKIVDTVDVFAISEIRLWLGAQVATLPAHTPSTPIVTLDPNTALAHILYSTDAGSTWTTIATDIPLVSTHMANPVSIPIPTIDAGILATINGWGIELVAIQDAPIILRGCKFLDTTISATFVDSNHSPSTLVPVQTYIHPGSADMDTDLISMYQQRIVMAASSATPFSLWFSKTADIAMFYASRPILDTDAFSVSIPATRAARILHLASDKSLIAFTEGGLYALAGSDSEGFSYRNCKISKIANVGASTIPPVPTTNNIIFVAEDRRTLYEIRYDLAQDSLIPLDRSVLAPHLTEASAITTAAWQQFPDGVLYSILADGSVIAFTYLPEHEVFAWSRHTIGGATAITDAIIPGSLITQTGTETSNKLIFVATVGAKTYLLQGRNPISTDTPTIANAACLDLAQPHTVAAPVSTITPAHPYATATIVTAINTTTGALATLTSNGTTLTATTNLAAGTYLIGIPVSATLHTLRPELPDRNIQGMAKNITDTIIRVSRSRSLSVAAIATPATTSAPATLRTEPQAPAPAAPASGLIPLWSGDIRVAPAGLINHDGRLAVTDTSPWPLEILSTITIISLDTK